MLVPVLGVLIIAAFFFLEALLRTGAAARSWRPGGPDRHSTMAILIAYVICAAALLGAPLLERAGIAPLPRQAGWPGIAVASAGLALRVWSMRVLGEFYTRTLQVAESQGIVRSGPYRWIRHPGYLGSILIWSGVALSTANWLSLVVVLVVLLGVYSHRIRTEEQMLLAANAAYAEYRKSTWRLLPPLY